MASFCAGKLRLNGVNFPFPLATGIVAGEGGIMEREQGADPPPPNPVTNHKAAIGVSGSDINQ